MIELRDAEQAYSSSLVYRAEYSLALLSIMGQCGTNKNTEAAMSKTQCYQCGKMLSLQSVRGDKLSKQTVSGLRYHLRNVTVHRTSWAAEPGGWVGGLGPATLSWGLRIGGSHFSFQFSDILSDHVQREQQLRVCLVICRSFSAVSLICAFSHHSTGHCEL